MPEGSSSAAPVTSPGPSFENNEVNLPRLVFRFDGVNMRRGAGEPLNPSSEMHHETDQEQDQENHKEQLGNCGKSQRHTGESENGK